jgi:hypothetical protein
MNVDDSGFSDVIVDRPGREVNSTDNAGSLAMASFGTFPILSSVLFEDVDWGVENVSRFHEPFEAEPHLNNI